MLADSQKVNILAALEAYRSGRLDPKPGDVTYWYAGVLKEDPGPQGSQSYAEAMDRWGHEHGETTLWIEPVYIISILIDLLLLSLLHLSLSYLHFVDPVSESSRVINMMMAFCQSTKKEKIIVGLTGYLTYDHQTRSNQCGVAVDTCQNDSARHEVTAHHEVSLDYFPR